MKLVGTLRVICTFIKFGLTIRVESVLYASVKLGGLDLLGK